MNYYAVVFLYYYLPHIYYEVNPSLRGKRPAKPRKLCQRRGGRHSSHCAIVNLLRIAYLLRRSIFSAAGSLGRWAKSRNSYRGIAGESFRRVEALEFSAGSKAGFSQGGKSQSLGSCTHWLQQISEFISDSTRSSRTKKHNELLQPGRS